MQQIIALAFVVIVIWYMITLPSRKQKKEACDSALRKQLLNLFVPGEKIKLEGALSANKVMIICPKTNTPSRIGYKVLADGKKERFAKVSGASLDNVSAAKSPATKTSKAKSKKSE